MRDLRTEPDLPKERIDPAFLTPEYDSFWRLIQALKHPKENVREEAVAALSERGEPVVLPLIEALKDRDAGTRSRVAIALGNIGDRRAALPLCRIFLLYEHDLYFKCIVNTLRKI